MRQIVRAQADKPASLDVLVARLAVRQHGVVSRRQLLAIGFGGDAIWHRMRTGRLHAIHPGVYAVGHPLLQPHSRCMAAVLACGGGAVLSHRSAAALWGLRPPPSTDAEVTVRRAGGRSRRGIVIHATRSLEPSDVETCEGIRCTSVARTLVDLAAVLGRRQLRHALERSLELRLFDRPPVDPALQSPGRRGIGVLRDLLAEVPDEPAPVRRELERRFLQLVRERGLPIPAVNAVVAGHVVDFHWPRSALIVETDGRATHDTARQFEEDRRRDLELSLAGWHVIRVGWRQVVHEPARVVALLKSRLS